MNIARLFHELGALGDIMLWCDGKCLNYGTSTMVAIVDFVRDATILGERIRVHKHTPDGVVAYEVLSTDKQFKWIPAADVTPGVQTPASHPFYEILDDLRRLKGKRVYTFMTGPGEGAVISVDDDCVTLQVRDTTQLSVIQCPDANEAAYEFVGLTGFLDGSLRVSMFSHEPPYTFYVARSEKQGGLRWLPEEYAFELQAVTASNLQEMFGLSEHELEKFNDTFSPSYFYFDYPKEAVDAKVNQA